MSKLTVVVKVASVTTAVALVLWLLWLFGSFVANEQAKMKIQDVRRQNAEASIARAHQSICEKAPSPYGPKIPIVTNNWYVDQEGNFKIDGVSMGLVINGTGAGGGSINGSGEFKSDQKITFFEQQKDGNYLYKELSPDTVVFNFSKDGSQFVEYVNEYCGAGKTRLTIKDQP